MTDPGFTYRITGDVQVQRKFQTAGTDVRQAVEKAIRSLGQEGVELARRRAPVGTGKKYGRYQGHGYIPRGINFYMAGDEIGRDVDSRVILGKQINVKDAVVGVIHSAWFVGRFLEQGVDAKGVRVISSSSVAQAHAATAYAKAFDKYALVLSKKKTRGGIGPMTRKEYGTAVSRAVSAASKAAAKHGGIGGRKSYQRDIVVAKRPFMQPAREALESKFQATMEAAVAQAVGK